MEKKPHLNTSLYLRGVERARRMGLIRFFLPFEPEPGVAPFSNHIDWKMGETLCRGVLSFTNTRPLHGVVSHILDYYAQKTVRFLELGPGAGNACHEFYLLAKKKGVDATLAAVSYTPVNPFVPMLVTGDELYGIVSGSPALEIVEKGPGGCLWRIATEEVFQIHNRGEIPIFGESRTPYIQSQCIGDYPGGISFRESGFDIVYDMNGPLHRRDTAPILDAYSRLSDVGVLFFVFNARYLPGRIILEGARGRRVPFFGGQDTVVVDTTGNSVLVARKNSPPAMRFRSKFDRDFQAVTTLDMIDFMKWLEK